MPLPFLSFGDEALAVIVKHAGMRWPHHNCRETHHGWIFSSQLTSLGQVSGTILIAPDLAASIAGPAKVLASTYHWSVSHGSDTAPSGRRRKDLDKAVLDAFERPGSSSNATPHRAPLWRHSEQLLGDQDVTVEHARFGTTC